MSSDLSSSKTFWEKFFVDAGFQHESATDFAILFKNHHLTKEMLLDISKEHLIDMGINIIGDIILIQKHAKFVYNKEFKQLHTSKYKTDSLKALPSIGGIMKDETSLLIQSESMDVDVKEDSLKSANQASSASLIVSRNSNAPILNKQIIKEDKVIEPSLFSPITKLPPQLNLKGEMISTKYQGSQKAPLATNAPWINASPLHRESNDFIINSSLYAKSISHGIFANEDRPYQNILGKSSSYTTLQERLGNPVTVKRVAKGTSFTITVRNDNKQQAQKKFIHPHFNLKNRRQQINLSPRLLYSKVGNKISHQPVIHKRTIQKHGLNSRPSNSLRTINTNRQNVAPISSRLGKKSAKERLG